MGALDSYINQLIQDRTRFTDDLEDEITSAKLQANLMKEQAAIEYDSSPVTLQPGQSLQRLLQDRETAKRQAAIDIDADLYDRVQDVQSRRQQYDNELGSKINRIYNLKSRGLAEAGRDAPGISSLRQEMVLDPVTGQVSARPKQFDEDEVRIKEIAAWTDLPEEVVHQQLLSEAEASLDAQVKLENIDARRAAREASRLGAIDSAQKIAERAEKARLLKTKSRVEEIKSFSSVPGVALEQLLQDETIPQETKDNARIASIVRDSEETMARNKRGFSTLKARRRFAYSRVMEDMEIKNRMLAGDISPSELTKLVDYVMEDTLTQHVIPTFNEDEFMDDFGPGGIGADVFNSLDETELQRVMKRGVR